MTLRVKSEQEGQTLFVEGDMRLPEMEHLRQQLLELLGAGGPTVIDLRDSTSIDLSGLQLLASARRTFQNRSRPLEIRDERRQLQAACRAAGFTCFEATEGSTWQRQS